MKERKMKKIVAYPVIAGIAMLSLTQCAPNDEGENPEENGSQEEVEEVEETEGTEEVTDGSVTEEQLLVSDRIDDMHAAIRDVETDFSEEVVEDIVENQADSEYYPDLEAQFEDIAEEYFSTENLDVDEMFQLNLTLAVLNDSLTFAESTELPITAPPEYVEIEGEEATAQLVFTEEEMNEEDYENSEDFDDYESYIEYSIEEEQSDVIEMVKEDGDWVVLFF